MTAALEEGEWSAARPGRSLLLAKVRYPFYWRLDGPKGLSGWEENLIPNGSRSWTDQPVVSRYTDWATRPTYVYTHTHTHIYLYTGLFISPWNMLENGLMPQMNEDSNDYIFQQDGSPAHYKDVRGYLNRNLPQRWIGRTGKEDDALIRWPPRSPDLNPCDFFFCRFVKDTVFVPPLPSNLQIFTSASPLLWLWSTVICWHACGTRWTVT